MSDYMNNSIYSYPNYGQQQYAQNFGMVNPQPSQQFTGVVTPETLQDPSHEPGLFETIFNPFSLIFLPLTLSDPHVKKYIKEATEKYGTETIKDPAKKLFNKISYMPKFRPIANMTQTKPGLSQVIADVKGIKFGNIWQTSVVDVHNKELYKSFIKEGKTAQEIENIAHAGKATTAQKNAILEAIKERGTKGVSKNALGNGFRSLIGEGAVGKFVRRIPVVSTILFGAMEIPEVMAASKYGTAETIKQVGKSALTVGGDVIAFSAGTSAGASIGATVGMALGPVGALVGGAIGGLVGGLAASHVTRKVIGGAYEMIFGKAKHKEAEKEEFLLAQQQAAQQVQEPQTVQPAAFGSYTQPQQQAYAPQFQGGYPPMTANISLGDENMFNNMNSAYNMYQMAS